MHDKQPTLLLTRPRVQSLDFLSICENLIGNTLPALVSPILQIKKLGSALDFETYATIILTSSNGVAACGDALAGRRVVTVGAKTRETANQLGAQAESLGEDVEAFLERAGEIKAPALFCRGAHSRGDLVTRLNAKGIKSDEIVVYDQIAQRLTFEAVELLRGSAKVVAPVFSPRSARLLCANDINAEIQIIAMSQAVADAWTGPGTIQIAASPNAQSMAKLTVLHF
ncbi:MAG: uroporphyrinogen-III synthase [Paracoccaceae bacterium]